MADVAADLEQAIRNLRGPIAVFGAGGFIGANLIRGLLAVRQDCYAVTHRPDVPWRLAALPPRHVVQADLTDAPSLASLFARQPFRTIFNLAAFGTAPGQDDAVRIYQTNVVGLVNLIERAAVQGFTALVDVGTTTEYGLDGAAPGDDAQLSPSSHYAVSKVSSAYLIRYYGLVKRLPVIHLRLGSVYGPLEDPGRLVPSLLGQGGGLPPHPAEANPSWDLLYVEDAVAAVVAAACQGVQRFPGGAVNIVSGTSTTLAQAAKTAQAARQSSEEPVSTCDQDPTWTPRDGHPATDLAQQLLGWKARTSLQEGFRRTFASQSRQAHVGPAARPADATLVGTGTSPPDKRPPRLSAIIACYRDAQAIPPMHKRLSDVFSSLAVDYEIIFVNDGSPDESDAVLEQLTANDDHVLAIEHSRNFGSQNAFISGMQIATGDAVILLDGDLQDPPEVIPAFYEKWQRGNDVVYGRRTRRETSTALAICYKAFYKIFRRVSCVPMPLDAGDFSLMDRKVVDQLLALPETDAFVRGLRTWVGFRQTGIDYVRPARAFGRSNNGWLKNIWWAKKAIFSFSFLPMELLGYAGLTMTALSFAAAIYEIVDKVRRPQLPHGISTIIVLILLLGSLNILAMAVLGEYLIKVFEETKRRPKFIRKAVRQGKDHFHAAAEMDDFLARRKSMAQQSTDGSRHAQPTASDAPAVPGP